MDRPDVRRVADVTGGGGNADRTARTGLCQGMEGDLLILDELSVDRTMEDGLGTVNGVAQMYEYLVYGHEASWYADSMCRC